MVCLKRLPKYLKFVEWEVAEADDFADIQKKMRRNMGVGLIK